MLRYELPNHHQPAPSFWKRNAWWLIPLLVIDAIVLVWWLRSNKDTPTVPPAASASALESLVPDSSDATDSAPTPPPGLVYVFPSPQQNLLSTNAEGVFMPTASGRLESALYGSVRTSQQGKHLLPSFHEGLDIGPVERDRRQMPTDPIFNAADGRVAYVNRIAGNSNYGKYVVITHNDPVGEIYTLYAHLADIPTDIRAGRNLLAGDRIGLMGNTSSGGIPVSRAHLHFEIGMINNTRFQHWYRQQKLKPDHGNYHGHNLTGINPLDIFRWQEAHGSFSMQAYLMQQEPAFELVFRAGRRPDYFNRYPGLWRGRDSTGGAITMTVSEGGVPLIGRPATEQEKKELGNQDHQVLDVNADVLNRNGLRLVVKRGEAWQLGRNGERWLEILTHY